jgi:succinate dehydrogenase subunit C
MALETKTASKEYIRPMPATWWLKNPAYTRFMIRDVTSVFIALYCVFLMVLMYYAGQDQATFDSFYRLLASPLSLVLHAIALVFAVYHSVTFFNLTPRAIVVFRGEEKVPEATISGAHYTAWVLVSLLLLIFALVL